VPAGRLLTIPAARGGSPVHRVTIAVNQLVDAVFVLSVATFADRIAHITGQMRRHAIEFEFVFEFDANVIPDELVERLFAPSDMKRAHQSLVLKHVHTWRECVRRGLRRVLVFEDDAVLADDFAPALAAALREADSLGGPWMIYLGRGDNQYVGTRGASGALVPGGTLPATDALVFNREAARARLAFLETHRITRPADWLMRETDAAVGVPHYWLARPIVEQGSMSGRFESVLDDRRRVRGRAYAWLRWRWDKWWRGLRHGWRSGERR
jgi:glycosyl transferase family 25